MGHLPYDIVLKTTFWVVVMCYVGVVAVLFLLKSKKTAKDAPSQKAIYAAMGLFLLFYIFARIFFILSDFERDPHGQTDLYFQYVAASYICSIIGFLFLIVVGEKYIIVPGKFYLTYVIIGFLGFNIIMLVFFPWFFAIGRYINYGLLYFEVAIAVCLYLYLISKTSGELRKNALITLIGLILMAVASFLESDALISSGIVQPYYSPILFAIGVTFLAYGQMKGI